ncbi:uncharacterized protein I206_100413 [Kwoniella pini CBS 10737]|uniref:Bacteriophage T5 Orf172 DNA-binding domain-containing protein n=1 Tax=Kwoniella pini CBS 10737 TaxID=1296096 RepID=A0A1B9IDI6_9TREE|nr:uncharacterized protein I206_00912 [Kwoniella pini CBS 10737]OCF53606.1 hypothetical protein I206_00912 [Kwoniella pini CBS 10737]
MSYIYPPNPSSHQQAFPPSPSQYSQQHSPQVSYPSGPSNFQNFSRQQDTHHVYQPLGPHLIPPSLPSTSQSPGRRRIGYDYLASLSTSVSNLSVEGAPTSYQTDTSTHNPIPSSSYYPSEPECRLQSDSVSPNYNKRLPALPPPPKPSIANYQYRAQASKYRDELRKRDPTPPPLPPRPRSLPLPDVNYDASVSVLVPPVESSFSEGSQRPASGTAGKATRTPPRTFKPSIHPHSKPRTSDENRLLPPSPRTPPRPYSDPSVPMSSKSKSKAKTRASLNRLKDSSRPNLDPDYDPIIDLTLSSSEEEDDSAPQDDKITPRSPARRRRAASERTPVTSSHSTPSRSLGNVKGLFAVQCSGFTRTGQPCKRLVKTAAPYLSDSNTHIDEGDERSDKVMGRYCKDHAGLICQAHGFYWRGDARRPAVWIDFKEFIPSDLGQQTQTLLRMTMESKLTPKELPGYLYAYELRDLETPTVVYFKIGRTDNVPRRIGEWTNQCQSKTPTLRDIFPLPSSRPGSRATAAASGLHRSGTLTTSYLPGATTHLNAPSKAMKRWERLVHLELADRSASMIESGKAFEEVREKCKDCGLSHREIFPLYKNGKGAQIYETIVVEAIKRWNRFIERITDEAV